MVFKLLGVEWVFYKILLNEKDISIDIMICYLKKFLGKKSIDYKYKIWWFLFKYCLVEMKFIYNFIFNIKRGEDVLVKSFWVFVV